MASLTKWAPTVNMLSIRDIAQDCDYDISVTALCKGAGIARQTWYDYNENPEFVRWWDAALELHFSHKLPGIYRALESAALGKTGICSRVRTSAAKLLLERFDKRYQPKTRQELSGQVPVKTYINIDTDRVSGKDSEREGDDGSDSGTTGSNDPGSGQGAHSA